MYPSKPNSNAEAYDKNSEAQKQTTTSSSTSGEKQAPPTDFAYQSSNPSAPLLPATMNQPYNSEMQNMEPPPYSSVVAQDSNDARNRSSSFSGPNNLRPYPPASPYITGAKSTSGIDQRQPPYPTGPGLAQGATNQAPYPTGGNFPSYGAGAQAPYPAAPGGFSAPYPAGPSLGTGVASQPPYSTGSGYTPGPASQAPYPVAPMPMPAPIDNHDNRQIGFTAPVTTEPKSTNMGYSQVGQYGYGQPSAVIPPQGMQPGLVHPTVSAEDSRKRLIAGFAVVFFFFICFALFKMIKTLTFPRW